MPESQQGGKAPQGGGGGGSQTQQPSSSSQTQQTPKSGQQPKKMKVHLESTGPIFSINGGYGPMYNLELDKDTVLLLLREGIYVTDAETRKRIILKDGEPTPEK